MPACEVETRQGKQPWSVGQQNILVGSTKIIGWGGELGPCLHNSPGKKTVRPAWGRGPSPAPRNKGFALLMNFH